MLQWWVIQGLVWEKGPVLAEGLLSAGELLYERGQKRPNHHQGSALDRQVSPMGQ